MELAGHAAPGMLAHLPEVQRSLQPRACSLTHWCTLPAGCWLVSGTMSATAAAKACFELLHRSSWVSRAGCGAGVQVLVPASQFLRSLVAARLAADVLEVPSVLIARTDAHSAQLLTSDIDELDKPFCTGSAPPRASSATRAASRCAQNGPGSSRRSSEAVPARAAGAG